jgi:hypothetical protein
MEVILSHSPLWEIQISVDTTKLSSCPAQLLDVWGKDRPWLYEFIKFMHQPFYCREKSIGRDWMAHVVSFWRSWVQFGTWKPDIYYIYIYIYNSPTPRLLSALYDTKSKTTVSHVTLIFSQKPTISLPYLTIAWFHSGPLPNKTSYMTALSHGSTQALHKT